MISKDDIQNGKIIQVDDFVESNEATELWYMAFGASYKYGHTSDSRSSQRQGRLTSHMDPEIFGRIALWKQIQSNFHAEIKLNDVYINFADSSSIHLPHTDNTNKKSMSILISLNQKWDRNYGGFTYFFESMNSQKVIETIVPEPRKAVFFSSSIWHCGSAPTIFAPDPRFMLAIKAEFNEE